MLNLVAGVIITYLLISVFFSLQSLTFFPVLFVAFQIIELSLGLLLRVCMRTCAFAHIQINFFLLVTDATVRKLAVFLAILSFKITTMNFDSTEDLLAFY